MMFSIAGLSYFFGFVAIGILAFRFFQSWQRGKTIISECLFCFVALLTLAFFIVAIAGLFFANNSKVLSMVVPTVTFTEILASAILGYLIIYIKFPTISPIIGFFAVLLLGVAAEWATIAFPFHPFLEAGRGVNWDIQPLAGILRFFIMAITFLPLIIIFLQEYRKSNDKRVKYRSAGFSAAVFLGMMAGISDFLSHGIISTSILSIFFSAIIIVTIILTKRPPRPKEKYTASSYPEIKW